MDEFAVVGHVAVDKIITSNGSRVQLGGPPTYIALVARRLGAAVKVVTKVGGDLPSDYMGQLRELGIGLRGQIVEGAKTTRFTLDYRGAERRLSVESVCEEITPDDVSDLPEAVIIAPVLDEVPPATSEAMTGSRLIALDPQGFAREVSHDGSVRPRRWSGEGLLSRVEIYKSSSAELRLVTGEIDPWSGLRRILSLGAEVAIATQGAEGALMLTREGRYRIPALNILHTRDLTGAGDAFTGGFLAEYRGGGDALWSASVGAAAASSVVETFGARLEASYRELRRRAKEVYNNVVEL